MGRKKQLFNNKSSQFIDSLALNSDTYMDTE